MFGCLCLFRLQVDHRAWQKFLILKKIVVSEDFSKEKPISLKDYFIIGRYYVLKKLVYAVIILAVIYRIYLYIKGKPSDKIEKKEDEEA